MLLYQVILTLGKSDIESCSKVCVDSWKHGNFWHPIMHVSITHSGDADIFSFCVRIHRVCPSFLFPEKHPHLSMSTDYCLNFNNKWHKNYKSPKFVLIAVTLIATSWSCLNAVRAVLSCWPCWYSLLVPSTSSTILTTPVSGILKSTMSHVTQPLTMCGFKYNIVLFSHFA